uniref:Uncharacterized protein n=1 Tax=Arundo donax TaxID=35708 RepID=A0A0A9ABH7_ARUDO
MLQTKQKIRKGQALIRGTLQITSRTLDDHKSTTLKQNIRAFRTQSDGASETAWE